MRDHRRVCSTRRETVAVALANGEFDYEEIGFSIKQPTDRTEQYTEHRAFSGASF
jgi:hypothetical protein